ncbi:MAG TPA: hypothetical protein VGK04_11090, partial [Thermoanaerobaculia bacterium]
MQMRDVVWRESKNEIFASLETTGRKLRPVSSGEMKRRIGIVVVVFAVALFAALPAAFGDDPFAIKDPLIARAIFSCTDFTMSDGKIDSSGVSTPDPTNRGHVASNGNVKLSGGALIDG